MAAFAADLDDFKGLCGERWPLLLAIHKELKGKTYKTTGSPKTKNSYYV